MSEMRETRDNRRYERNEARIVKNRASAEGTLYRGDKTDENDK